MKDFYRDDLKCKEIPSKPQEKDSYNHHIWDFAYFYKYGHQYLTYLPQNFLSTLLFRKKVWLRNTLPTYGLDICPNFYGIFFLRLSLTMIIDLPIMNVIVIIHTCNSITLWSPRHITQLLVPHLKLFAVIYFMFKNFINL